MLLEPRVYRYMASNTEKATTPENSASRSPEMAGKTGRRGAAEWAGMARGGGMGVVEGWVEESLRAARAIPTARKM
jgi:hypothetical protein